MKIIEGKKHYSAKEIGLLVGRTHLTVHLWDKWSDELEDRGDKRFIPAPLKIGKQQTRYWSEDYVPEIMEFAKNIKRGDLAEFSQRQWKKQTPNKNHPKKPISIKNRITKIEKEEKLETIDKLIYFLLLLTKDDRNYCNIKEKEVFSCINIEKDELEETIKKLMDLSLIKKDEDNFILT